MDGVPLLQELTTSEWHRMRSSTESKYMDISIYIHTLKVITFKDED